MGKLYFVIIISSLIALARIGNAADLAEGGTLYAANEMPAVDMQTSTGTITTPLFFPKEQWGFRLESELKSTYDKQKNVDGYDGQYDVKAYRAIDEEVGLSLGGRIINSERKSKASSPARLDEGAAGFRTVFGVGETKIRADWTYNSILTDETRKAEFHDGYFLADIRSHLFLSYWGKVRARVKHWEYVLNSNASEVLLRQTKFELSPGYNIHKVFTGIKNQVIHRAYARNQENTYEIGPFIRYEGKHFEPLAKVIYRPVKDSSEFRIADNWSREPIYSIELDLKF